MNEAIEAAFDIAQASLPGAAFHELLAQHRQRGPVADIRFLGYPAKVICRHAELQQAFRDGDRFPPEVSYRLSTEPVVGRTFISMPQAEHNVYRKLAAPFFNRRAIESLAEEEIVALCDELLAPLLRTGSADLVADFTRILPLRLICRMLGLPEHNTRELQAWALALLSFPVDPEGAMAASREFSHLLLPLIRQRRETPGTDLISALTQSRIGDQLLSDEDIASHIRLLFPTGADTTYLALGNLIYALLTQDDSWQLLLEDRSLLPGAVEELLRWESPTPLIPRMSAAEPVTAFGHRFPPNTPVLFGVGAANRDPAVFADPDRFDPTRDNANILTFGPGLRTCPGMHLARKELRIALGVLLDRCPGLRLVDPVTARPTGTILRGPAALKVTVA